MTELSSTQQQQQQPVVAAQSAWGRGGGSFAAPIFTQQQQQQASSSTAQVASSVAVAASASNSWRGGGGAGSAAVATNSRWPAPSNNTTAAPASKSSSHDATDDTAESSESSSRSWFDGQRGGGNGPSSGGVGASSSAWRSHRVDKIKSDSGSNSAHSTPQLNAQVPIVQPTPLTHKAPSNSTKDIVYQASDFGNTDAPGVKWFYLDPQNVTQGPFSTEDMREWYENAYFDLKLPVQCMADVGPSTSTKFIPLGVWFLHGNKAFLLTLPDIVEQRGVKPASAKVDAAPLVSSSPAGGISAAVLASDRNALSPVDESSSYAASVHQLVADDDDNLESDVTELARYNSGVNNSQATSQQNAQGGLNPTAQPWNQRGAPLPGANANWQQQPQGSRGPAAPSAAGAQPSAAQAWTAPPSANGPRAPSNAPAQSGAPTLNGGGAQPSLSMLQQQQQQRAQLAQQLQQLPALNAQYNQYHPLTIPQFLQGFNLTQAQITQLNPAQMTQLQQQFQTINQQRFQRQAQLQQQIQQILLAQQLYTQQLQQQQGGSNPLSFQQQLQQQAGQNSYQQQQQRPFGQSFGGQPNMQQQQQQFGLNPRSNSPLSQQQVLQQNAYQQRPGYGQQDLSKSNWNGQQQQPYGAYPDQQQYNNLSLHPQQQQPTDINQTIVYTPNQVTAVDYQQQPQQMQPQQQAQQQPPQQQAAVEEAPADQADEAQPAEEQPAEEYEEAAAEEEAESEQPAAEDGAADAEQEDAASEPEQPVAHTPSVAPWVAKVAAVAEQVKVKSLLEIQAEEESKQKHASSQQADRQAAAARRTQPFNAAWGGQASALSLTPDETSTATVIHANNALLPTPPSTTPSIKLLTPILSTVKQPRGAAQSSQSKIGRNGRRTEPAIVQMDQPADAIATTASPVASPNAWGTKPAASPAAAKSDAPAPVVNAWASKRPVAGAAPTPLLPNPAAGMPTQTVTMLNPPLLTIRPRSMQNLDGTSTIPKPFNTVRILESQILEVQPTQQPRRSSASRSTGSSSARTAAAAPSSSASSLAKKPAATATVVDESAFGGPTMSSDFESWCKEHLTAIAGADGYDVSLPQFLMTVSSDDEARDYIHTYLGTSAQIDAFADEFLQLKAFEGVAPKDAKTENADEDQKRRRKRGGNQEF